MTNMVMYGGVHMRVGELGCWGRERWAGEIAENYVIASDWE